MNFTAFREDPNARKRQAEAETVLVELAGKRELRDSPSSYNELAASAMEHEKASKGVYKETDVRAALNHLIQQNVFMTGPRTDSGVQILPGTKFNEFLAASNNGKRSASVPASRGARKALTPAS